MQKNILFTFAIIFSIFYFAQAQIPKTCSYCNGQKHERRNPKIDRDTNFGLGVDPNYIFDRYTVKELQNNYIFPYNDLVIDKPKGVCVYEHKEGIKNTDLKQGTWYPIIDQLQRICKDKIPGQDSIFLCPNTDPKKSMCLITDGTAPLFKWYPTYPGKLFFFHWGTPGPELVRSYKTNGILGILASKDRGIVKYIDQDKAYRGGNIFGEWYPFSIRTDTLEQTCRKCPCELQEQNVCDADDIFSRV